MIPSSSGVLYMEHRQCLLCCLPHLLLVWALEWEDGRGPEREGAKEKKRREGGLFSPSGGTGFKGEVKFRDNQKRKGRIVEEFS